MAVNFSNSACVTDTQAAVFGICDDPPPPHTPAYIDFVDDTKWIVWVDNDDKKLVQFTAIDHCVEIFRADGTKESRCDCMLSYDDTLSFIELKDAGSKGWLGDAYGQLKATIDVFIKEVGLSEYNRFYAYVANKRKPYFKVSTTSMAAKFEMETGFVLRVDHVIEVR